MSRRVGVLTGTFDPVHLGHMALARAAREAAELDEVWFWINAEAAHKIGVTGYKQRLDMLKLAVQGEAGMIAYQGEFRDEPHLVPTFLRLIEGEEGTQFCFIMGADVFAQLNRWQGSGSVVNSAMFVVARRPGYGEGPASSMEELPAPLDEQLRVAFVEVRDYSSATSRSVREAVRAGERPESVNPRVLEYIVGHNLYR